MIKIAVYEIIVRHVGLHAVLWRPKRRRASHRILTQPMKYTLRDTERHCRLLMAWILRCHQAFCDFWHGCASHAETIDADDLSIETLQDQVTEGSICCLCQDKEDGKMIACDNSDYPFVWFHYACVSIKWKPKEFGSALNASEHNYLLFCLVLSTFALLLCTS